VKSEVGSADYWVEISQQGRKLGAGFVVTRHYVLTAFHCLRSIDPDDELVELSFASGEVAPGRLYESAPEADLALIDLLKPRDRKFEPLSADRARQGDAWFAPYRPRRDEPHLAGDVVSGAMAYRCETGHEIEALQLNCSQGIGNYSGYSGGPVERRGSRPRPSLIGVLLEQYPDRRADRASGVLFAATIAEAARRFNYLGVAHLIEIMTAPDGPEPEQPPVQKPGRHDAYGPAQASAGQASRQSVEPLIAKANSLLAALEEWGASSTLSPLDVSMLKRRVVRRLVDGDWARDQ
jgi:hypothetical protein